MNLIDKIKEALKHEVRCEGCNKRLENNFTARFHEWRCISNILGYDYLEEKFERSSRAYFFKLK